MRFYKNVLKVGSEELTVVTVNQEDGEEVQVVEKNPPVHHIQIIDRSGSMSGHIHLLVSQVQQTVEAMRDEDYISVVWFSSAGQYRTLVKGAKKSPELLKTLDELRSVYGTTCFSDPVKEVKIVVDELSTLCPNISITLFTDGQAVTPWSASEEEKKTFELVKSFKDKVIAFNTVGYGNFYNQDFLKKLSALTEFGIFTHSSEIAEYFSIFQNNYERIVEGKIEKVHLEYGLNIDGIYLNRKFTKMETLEMYLSRLDKNKNQFFLVSKEGDFQFMYNDQPVKSKEITETAAEPTIRNFLYAYANGLFYLNRKRESLDILLHLRDKALIDSHMSSFTYDECSEHQKMLEKATLHTSGRNIDGEARANYLPAKDAFCVMDLLNMLANSYSYYMPFHKDADQYNRIGRKTEDEFNLFTRTEEPVLSGFEAFVWNKERVNLGINVLIPGTVSINPKEAERVGLPRTIESRIFRTYNLISDGHLNQKRIVGVIPEKLYNEIQSKRKVCEIIDLDKSILKKLEVEHGEKYVCVKFHLYRIPIINQMYAEYASAKDVFGICYRALHLEAKQKWLNSFWKEFEANSTAAQHKVGIFEGMSSDQMQVLEAHGLRKDGTYSPVATKVAKKDECQDSYETRAFKFSWKGVSSLPSIKDAKEKIAAKKSTVSVEVMEKALLEVQKEAREDGISLDHAVVETRDWLTQEILDVKSELFTLRTKLACAKMCHLLNGSSFTDFQPDAKGTLAYEQKGMSLLLKTYRVTEYL
jgi:hypothetical protein